MLAKGMSKAGVFVGISWTEYAKMAAMHQVPVGAYTAQSAVLSVAAGISLPLKLLRHKLPCLH